MLINNLNVKKMGEISETLANTHAKLDCFYRKEYLASDGGGFTEYFYDSRHDKDNIIYAFHCNDDGWCILVEQYQILDDKEVFLENVKDIIYAEPELSLNTTNEKLEKLMFDKLSSLGYNIAIELIKKHRKHKKHKF